MNGKITGVSLGPGEPELITLKALNVLKNSDVIFCPGTVDKEGVKKSKSREILAQLPLKQSVIRYFYVPMQKDRSGANQVYDEICNEIAVLTKDGKKVAIVAEGDACFYSSANYMFEKLVETGHVVDMVAGVPAFIAAASSVGLHLVKQSERLLVVPGNITKEELQRSVSDRYTLVIMKVPLGAENIRAFIRETSDIQYYYFEHVGDDREFYTTDREEIISRPFTYFSVLVIKPKSL